MSVRETDDIWRLYTREWVTVHTTTHGGTIAEPCVVEAHDWANDNLIGRVPREDINLIAHTDGATMFWCHVQVLKDNLKGEFKYKGAAEVYAESHGMDDYTIVARNSKADHDIRAYGVKKL